MIISIITIQSGYINYDSLEKGCGGSETWALQLSDAFIKLGHNVLLFTNTSEHVDNIDLNKSLNIIPYEYLKSAYTQIDIDFTITSREIGDDISQFLLDNPNCCKIKFLQLHDIYVTNPVDEYINMYDKIVCLTPYQVETVNDDLKLDMSKYTIIPNGIDLKLFDNIDTSNKDNRILWCSNPDRGLYIILKYLYDPIKKVIPDFGVDICYPNYSSIDPKYMKLFESCDVNMLGSLSKKDLYKEMAKHKVWVYPQNFVDTFCIGVLENTMCETDVICPWWFGPRDIFDKSVIALETYPTFFDYKSITNGFYPVGFINTQIKDAEQYLNWLLNEVIYRIQAYNSDEYIQYRNKAKEYVINHYQWSDVAKSYLTLYKNTLLLKNED